MSKTVDEIPYDKIDVGMKFQHVDSPDVFYTVKHKNRKENCYATGNERQLVLERDDTGILMLRSHYACYDIKFFEGSIP